MPLTPLQLAQRTVMGSGLVVAGYCVSYLSFPSPFPHRSLLDMLWIGRWELLFSAVPFVAGWLLIWQNLRLLDRGLRDEAWAEPQLEVARAYLALPVFAWAIGLSIVACLSFMIAGFASSGFHGNMAYILIWAVNPISTMKVKLRIPIVRGDSNDWRTSAPIHSDHWGQPPTAA